MTAPLCKEANCVGRVTLNRETGTTREAGPRRWTPQSPQYERFRWPKQVPPLDAEQMRISNDFMKHWHEVLPNRYGQIEKFNHTYPLKILPRMMQWRTLELGAGIGAHLEFEDLTRQEYWCIELRQNMADDIRRRFPGVHTAVGDCQTSMPFDDEFFDRVVVVHVLEPFTQICPVRWMRYCGS